MNYTVQKLNNILGVETVVHMSIENHGLDILKKDKKSLFVETYDHTTHIRIKRLDFYTEELAFDKVYDFKFFAEINRYCICFGTCIMLFDLNGNMDQKLIHEDGMLGAKYFDKTKLYLELYEPSGNRSLGVWKTDTNKLSKFELESFGHYNRDFKIDKTNTILYGTANAYWSGVHLHVLNPSSEKLFYLYEKDLICGRDEIECYAIAINSIGDEYVMIVENDNGQIPVLCYYSVHKQSKPIGEYKLYEDSNILSNYKRTSFLQDDFICIVSQLKIAIYDPNNKTIYNKFELFEKDENSSVAINNLRGEFLFISDNEIKLCRLEENSKQIPIERVEKMNAFLQNIKAEKYTIKEVGS